MGILIWAVSRYEGPVTAGNSALFVLLLLNGTYLRYCVRMITVIPAFWLTSAEGFEILFFHMTRFLERPDGIFTGVTRVVLTTVLPFCLMASFPARLFFGGFHAGLFWSIVAITAAFSTALAVFWRLGLRAYSSASS